MARIALEVQPAPVRARPRVENDARARFFRARRALRRPEVWQHPRVVPTAGPPTPGRGQPTAASLPEGASPHFALFGIPVRVGLGFWLVSLFLGFQPGRSIQDGVRSAIAWTVIVFVSVLLHELGHALVARRYGARPSIFLHAFGGLTAYATEGVQLTRGRRILISLAGPFAGFVFGTAVWLVARRFSLTEGQNHLVRMVLFVNVGWGLINLLPVLPLDGGNVLAAALGPKRAFATAIVSGTVAAIVAILGLQAKLPFVVVLFGFAAFNAFSQARVARENDVDHREGLDEQLLKAKAALDRGELDDAFVLADDVVRRARTAPVRNGGYTALAWIHVGRGEGRLARRALEQVEPHGAVDPYTWAAVEDAAGTPDRARAILIEARRQGYVTAEATKLLIDLLAREGRIEEAVEVTHEDAHLLAREDVRAVYQAAIASGSARAAARLAGRLFELHADADDAIDEARALATAGDVNAALAALAHAVQLGTVDREALRADPAFAALTGDERFERILAA